MPKKKLPNYPRKYGPGILDPDVYEDAVEVTKSKRDRYGPGVLDPPEGADEAPEGDESTTDEAPPEKGSLSELLAKHASQDGYVSIDKLKELLAEMPSAFDRMFSWELARVDGPRIGALEHLMKLETGVETCRPLVVQAIEVAITKARGE